MEKKIETFEFGGDGVVSITGPGIVDASAIGYFDEAEYDCWELIKKYAKLFGFKVNEDENGIDFYAAKQVQDAIIGLFQGAGVKMQFDPGLPIWYGVRTSFYDNCKVKAEMFTVNAAKKPENCQESYLNRDVYMDYFNTENEAQKHCDDATRA